MADALNAPQALPYLPYFIASGIAGFILLYVLGGLAQWWSLHPWRVGIRAALKKKQKEHGHGQE